MPYQVAQLTLAQLYYFKNIAWYNKCSTSQIDIKTYDELLSGNSYSIKKHKFNKKLVMGQEEAIKQIIKDGKKPSIKLIREYMQK